MRCTRGEQGAMSSAPLRFDEDGETLIAKGGNKGQGARLEQRFPAGEYDERQANGGLGQARGGVEGLGEPLDFPQDLGSSRSGSARERVGRVAIGAARLAVRRTKTHGKPAKVLSPWMLA